MVERTVRVGSTHGLHARPAKLFTQAAAASGSSVTIAKSGGAPVNAASILAVLAPGIAHGDAATVAVAGGDEQRVLAALVELLSTDHDE